MMKKIEIGGMIILLLVVAAFTQTPAFFRPGQETVTAAMIGLIGVLAVTALVRTIGKVTRYGWLMGLGTALLILGAYVFFMDAGFFGIAATLPLSFWHRVTLYTLPAICVEGGLLTLLTVFLEKAARVPPRERTLVLVMFPLYAVAIIATNFLAVGGIVPVEIHVEFSRIVIIAMVVVISGAYFTVRSRGPQALS